MAQDALRLAVLIDADNASAAVIKELLEEVAKYGVATVKRSYGDWTTQNLVGWKDHLHRHAIQPMQQFAYTKGKNSTDSAWGEPDALGTRPFRILRLFVYFGYTSSHDAV